MLNKFRFLAQDLLTHRTRAVPYEVAIREAIDWIYRAQDQSDDRGVSHSYHLDRGWAPSYPETTGYIIPTLLNWAQLSGEVEACQRALEMADWESDIQLPDGGVIGSVVNQDATGPVVFNTGQVIFGWVAAHRETGSEKYLRCAARAADWLIEQLGSNNSWNSHGSMGSDRAHTYNIRVAWALLEYGKLLDSDAYMEPVQRVTDWVLSREETAGWFNENCLSDNDRPLLHTIAYTARGLLEVGVLLDLPPCVDAAARTADAVIAKIGPDGFIAGRFDKRWETDVKWSCLTGMAQMSIVLLKLFDRTQHERYRDGAFMINRYLRARQRVGSVSPGMRGGITGSYPVNGKYGTYRVLNWATKFFIDALLLEAYPALRRSDKFYAG